MIEEAGDDEQLERSTPEVVQENDRLVKPAQELLHKQGKLIWPSFEYICTWSL